MKVRQKNIMHELGLLRQDNRARGMGDRVKRSFGNVHLVLRIKTQ